MHYLIIRETENAKKINGLLMVNGNNILNGQRGTLNNNTREIHSV